MNFIRYIKKSVLILFFLASINGFAQLSKTHYIPPLTSAEFGNANPEDQYIYLSTPSNSDIPYTIKPVGQPITSYITGIVSNTNPREVFIGSGNGQLFISSSQTSTVVNDKGYIIEAEGAIYVSVRMEAGGGAQAGALVSKGLSALGTTFRVGTYTNQNPQDNYLNFVSVMATEDNTQVNFSDLPGGLNIKNYSGTTPINVALNKGESYTIATNSAFSVANRDGLIGCLVSSDKNIVVNCGSANGSFHNGPSRDYGLDQIVGLDKVGKEYIFVKGDGENGWENILIVAHSNNTTISINGTPSVTTINAGDYYLIEGNEYNASGNMYVETSEDVFAYQGVGATNNEANQGMFFVPPLSCEARGDLDNIANIERIGFTTYNGGVSIVTKVGATVTINNTPLSSFSTIGPSNVDGNPNYVTYKVTGLFGNISVQSTDELYCAYFNFNGVATSGSFYSGFPTVPEINFDAQFATLGNCIPNITLEAANAQNFDSYEWYYDDGSGFQLLASNVPSITPTIPARYKLVGIITCTGETLESVEVPVSICPDDTDNDGIIDNIDIDNDNDGILNCTESRGDVTINLSNTNSPQLRFQDGSIDNLITSASLTQNNSSGNNSANSISGNVGGDFTSIVLPANSAESDYSVTFTESVNVKFSEHASISHISTDGEFFIAKILPVNKNITLVDPDDRLLVDSNFDGIFESGVTLISGSEIHFRINPLPTGNTPYGFFANQVDGFAFVHKLGNINNASTFNGNLSLTCFKKDNDLDGIKDALDLDSDNDGISDFVENQGILIALSGVDADSNGLDDVYDITALPIDTDTDGVVDVYDLDSDNDGIYDLIETNQLGLLSDTDLNGIEDGPTYGTNGWADAAETIPDSGIIGYTLNDSDGDLIFSYLDLDSDGDSCSDVIEAGFSDGNVDDLLGDNMVTVDGLGLVNNASDGYTIPHPNYLVAAPITIANQPLNTIVCEDSDTIISVISSSADTYQWEVSTDGTNWTALVDDAIYSGTTTSNLSLTTTPLSYDTFQYRVFLNLTGNSCGLYSDVANLTVNPLPIITTPVILVQCDDDDPTTSGFSAFNLTEANNKISVNAANETFYYFLTQAGAVSGDITSPDYISNDTTYTNATISSDTVWARVETAAGCASVSEVQLNVSTTAIPSTFQRVFYECDDFLDVNGNDNLNNDDRDGITTFDFSSVTTEVLALIPSGQSPLPPRYYRNEADALAEINEIVDPSNYRNIGYPGTQQIFIRIDSDIVNDCLGLGAHITLHTEALPIANPVNIDRQCDFDTTDAVITYPFDTSQIEANILNGQTLADVTVEYTYLDSDGITPIIANTLPNPFLTASQSVTVRITNNTTNDPDGPCSKETTLDFIVDEQPIANPVSSIIVCDGDAGDDDDDDGRYTFNLSTVEDDVLQGQNMDVFYTYTDEQGNIITRNSSLPSSLLSETQTIIIDLVNPDNSNCSATTTFDLIVNSLPEFTVNTPQIVCSSDPEFTLDLEPFEADFTEDFNYQWLFTSLDGSITNQFVSNTREITVSAPGTYHITLTKTDGTGCSRTREIFVNASELATITLDDVSIVDISEQNSVTINPNNLGLGDYEYALTAMDETFPIYQDEPFFDHVKAGFYTIFVRDKNGCGTAPLEISVIGYPKFFTPNNDGSNDLWQIKGVNAQFQPNSNIYIFDRYGKLLKQINPASPGWDGTYNNQRLNTDDYWFKVLLEDGRQFMGHFTLKR